MILSKTSPLPPSHTTDLRDRARFMTALVGLAPDSEGAEQTKMDETVLAEFAEHAKVGTSGPKSRT